MRLQHDRQVDAEFLAQFTDNRGAPGTKIGKADIADLAGAHEVRDRSHGFFQGRLPVLAMKTKDIQIIGSETLQAALGAGHDPVAERPRSLCRLLFQT